MRGDTSRDVLKENMNKSIPTTCVLCMCTPQCLDFLYNKSENTENVRNTPFLYDFISIHVVSSSSLGQVIKLKCNSECTSQFNVRGNLERLWVLVPPQGHTTWGLLCVHKQKKYNKQCLALKVNLYWNAILGLWANQINCVQTIWVLLTDF